jgi:hypothetical protein
LRAPSGHLSPIEKQFTLVAGNIKRDIITKEMDLLILPLKIIYREIDSRGVDKDWWNSYIGYFKRTPTDRIAAEKLVPAVDSADLPHDQARKRPRRKAGGSSGNERKGKGICMEEGPDGLRSFLDPLARQRNVK